MMQFEMTQEQLDKILEACKPVPYIAVQCGEPPSPQEMANNAWEALGEEMGFKHMTVRPTGLGDRFFMAEPKQTAQGENDDASSSSNG